MHISPYRFAKAVVWQEAVVGYPAWPDLLCMCVTDVAVHQTWNTFLSVSFHATVTGPL